LDDLERIGGEDGSRTHDVDLARINCSPLPSPWWTRSDSNRPPPQCDCGALPDELRARDWWTVRDSNSLPPQCHRGALPIELTARNLCGCVAPARSRVRTLPVGDSNPASSRRRTPSAKWCTRMESNHRRAALQTAALPLSYSCMFGADGGNRTHLDGVALRGPTNRPRPRKWWATQESNLART
jgi:hypothetical protein